MKKLLTQTRWLGSLLAVTALIGLPLAGRAQAPDPTETYVNNFDTENDRRSWIYWYGVNPGNSAIPLDPTKDASNNAESGSLAISIPFGSSGNQQVFFGTFGNQFGYDGSVRYNGNKFTNISVKVLVDSNAPVSSAGDFGVLEYSLVRSGFPAGGGPFFTTVRIPGAASNGWVKLNLPVPTGTEGYDEPGVIGVGFKYTSYSGYPQSPISFWLDELRVEITQIQLPPPTISSDIDDVSPGLNLLSVGGAGEYQRTSVKVVDTSGVSFVGQPSVTYSFTIREFPDPAQFPEYQAHIFLASGTGDNAALDYAEPNLIWMNVQGNADGTASTFFRYKINEPNANSNVFGAEYTEGPLGSPWAGQLAELPSPTAIGQWSLTIANDTNVTMSGPGGISTNFTIRPEVAAQFVSPLALVFGGQPNRPSQENPLGNIGQKVVLSEIAVTNAASSTPIVFENFVGDTALDPAKFAVLANGANSVFLFPNDPGQKIVKWSLPDAGFYLEVTTNLANPFRPYSGGATFGTPGLRNAVVPSSALNPDQSFFRLVKREFSKLQILLPGETAAPGTPSGKTGTPTPQQAGAPFPIVVNAVDSNWVRITSVTDQISLSSSDPAFNWPGFPGTMSGGTITFDVETWGLSLGTPGSQTITATDVTDGSKTSDTSSPVTVTQ